MKNRLRLLMTILGLWSVLLCGAATSAQTAAFTYQGKLTDNNLAANGTYQMQFALFDAANGGSQIGATITNSTVQVSNGIFTVSLDFDANAFSGANRFLQISVFSSATNAYITLAPRQQITSAPFAIKSLTAGNADAATNAINLGGSPASDYVKTNDSRLSDSRSPAPGSGNYIQNGTIPQSANFNIAGNGTASGTLSGSVVNSGLQYEIGGSRVLSVPGTANTFAGVGAGNANATGYNNTFFGKNAGFANTTGGFNSFFGLNAGSANTTGFNNAFFGLNAGYINSTASQNSFFGSAAGDGNTTGENNAFFGAFAGRTNSTGSHNTIVGASAEVGSNNLMNATAIGARAFATQNNSLVLGSINGINGATATVNVGIGTTTPAARLDVGGGDIRWANSQLKTDNGGNIELGGTNSAAGTGSPYIDFHHSSQGVEDYNVRLINDVDGRLSLNGNLRLTGILQFNTLGATGGTPLCRNAQNQIAACSASLVETGNSKSDSDVLKNQQSEIEQLRQQIALLKKLVCSQNAQAEVCKEEK